jgi:sugar-specific transcriptional regulator TrmB
VHRTLNSLNDKGMVRPSLGSPTTFAAVDLSTALDSTVKKRESELREMEVRSWSFKSFQDSSSFAVPAR